VIGGRFVADNEQASKQAKQLADTVERSMKEPVGGWITPQFQVVVPSTRKSFYDSFIGRPACFTTLLLLASSSNNGLRLKRQRGESSSSGLTEHERLR